MTRPFPVIGYEILPRIYFWICCWKCIF